MEHYYGTELNLVDPMASQPSRIKTALKPHQQAALEKAIRMEREGVLQYDVPAQVRNRNERWRTAYAYRGKMRVRTNVGVLGDLVGYGKTLTALSIVASTRPNEILRDTEYCYSSHGRHVAKFTATCERPDMTPDDHFINTTLVVVPRGPVYVQWLRTIREQTDLTVLAIDGLPMIRKYCPPPNASIAQMKEYFEQYDIVLIKGTTIRTMMDYYTIPYQGTQLVAWNRIMVDEAHDILKTVPFFDYRFMWLISATYHVLPSVMYGSRAYIVAMLRDIVTEDNLPFLLVRGNTEFVKSSFTVPEYTETFYMCQLPKRISAIQPFLNGAALERINANDIAGAIRDMGGANETEADIVELVTRDLQKDIRNKEQEIAYTTSIEIAEDYRQLRLASLNADLTRLRDKMQALTDRISQLSTKTCGICFEPFDTPIVLPCTHVYCGGCLMNWIRMNHKTCPECRTDIACNRMIAVVANANASANATRSAAAPLRVMDKVDTLIDIINKKPDGKFLIFSRVDSTFFHIVNALERINVSYSEIKGSTAHMMKILERFQRGDIRVILLNTHHAGSGIDISCATDAVIFHQMGADKVQAVGRAQRVGRVTPLHVHNLCYPHEM